MVELRKGLIASKILDVVNNQELHDRLGVSVGKGQTIKIQFDYFVTSGGWAYEAVLKLADLGKVAIVEREYVSRKMIFRLI